MVKVITTMVAENNMSFDEIKSFETQSYIGCWCEGDDNDGWYVFPKGRAEFYCKVFGDPDGLGELDEMIYNWCNEHIIEVYRNLAVKIELVQE